MSGSSTNAPIGSCANESVIALGLSQLREERRQTAAARQVTPAQASQIVKDKLGLDISESAWRKVESQLWGIKWYEYETTLNSLSPHGGILSVVGEGNNDSNYFNAELPIHIQYQLPGTITPIEIEQLSDIGRHAEKAYLKAKEESTRGVKLIGWLLLLFGIAVCGVLLFANTIAAAFDSRQPNEALPLVASIGILAFAFGLFLLVTSACAQKKLRFLKPIMDAA